MTEGAVSLRKSASSRKMDKEEADLGSATTWRSCHGMEKVAVMVIEKTTMSQRCAACALPLQHPHPRGNNTHTRSSVCTIPQCGVLAIREVQGAGVLNLRGGRGGGEGRGVCVATPLNFSHGSPFFVLGNADRPQLSQPLT